MTHLSAFIDARALLLVIAANSAPVLSAWLLHRRFDRPIDAGVTLPDGRALFGAHKTWRGLIAGTLAAALTGALLRVGVLTGAAFGLLTLLGDLLSSFLKRRLGQASGRSAPLIDQLPEALLPMLVLAAPLGLSVAEICGTVIAFTVLDLLAAAVLDRGRLPNRQHAAHSAATIICCVLAAFCEGMDLQAAGVAAGGIVPELRPDAQQLGTFFSASTLGLFFGALAGGRWSDLIGRRRVLIASIALFGSFSLLTPLAWDIRSLSWARLLTGLGLGGALPNLVALVNECSAANRRSANVALVYAGMPFGGALASLISMSIASSHWRWIFIAGGVAPLLIVPIMLSVLRESPAFERARSLVSAPGIAGGGPIATPRAGSFKAVLSGGRAVSTLLLWSSFFLSLVMIYLLLSWLPTLLAGNGLTKAQAAGAQIAFNVGGGLAALLVGRLLEGRLRRATVLTIFIAVPVTLLLLSRAPAQLLWVVLIVAALGCSVLAAPAFLYAVAPACYPTSIRGAGVGMAVAIGRIGSIVGPKLGGTLKAAGHSSSQLLTDLLPIAVLGSVTGIVLAWHLGRIARAAARKDP